MMAAAGLSVNDLEEIRSQDDETHSNIIVANTTTSSPASCSQNFSQRNRFLMYDCPPPDAVPEPIIIKGRGNVTVFGVNNRLDREFPAVLVGKVAPEEFNETVLRINAILQRQVWLSLKWLICGCLCCCCTLGCSLWPAVCLKKRTVMLLEKAVDWENTRLYHKIGLNLKLEKFKTDSAASLTEYILVVEFIPKVRLLRPD